MQATDIMIHINESLESDKQQGLESELRAIDGVIAPRFNKPHLLVVAYDSDVTSTPELLKQVVDKGYTAQIVGL
ncbi:MAG: hypothetical protein RPU34_03205 [Candidatus Sedimenticola sp. (ex Thyasira tokunagai)]